MAADEFLEKVVSDAYKRELEQQENIVRSLPFVATALALIATVLSLTRTAVPASFDSAYAGVVWVLFALCGISIGMSVYFLFFSIYPKQRFQYLSPTTELEDYLERLRRYHTSLGKVVSDIDNDSFEDFRRLMIDQYTVCATYNQIINFASNGAQTRAFTSLVIAISLAFGIVATISVHEVLKGAL